MSTAITPQTVHETIAKYLLPDVFPFVLDLEKSHGNRIYDSKAGRYLLDCFSFIASNPLGFNHPKMSDPEFERKLLRTAKIKPSNSDIYTVEMAEFVGTFARLALPPTFNHLFFVEGGALAVENALKAAFDWKVRKNFAKGASEEHGWEVIHFREAFHGRSGYTLSLTNTDPRKTKYFPKFKWPRVSNPKIRFPLEGSNLTDVERAEEQSLAEIQEVLRSRGAEIAAIIVETIQGEGGDNHFRAEFHRELRKVADENEVLLIYDEVQCGFGLTGKMWAFEHYGIKPDIFSFGKKAQVCGIAATGRIEEVHHHVFQEASRINSTWGGNLVDMVRAQRFLEIIHEDKLVENASKVGAELQRGLRGLVDEFPDLLSNARGAGLMCAIDLATTDKRNTVVKRVMENGAIILPCGPLSLRLRPSLTFSSSEVTELLDIIRVSLKGL